MDHFVCTKENSLLIDYAELKKTNEVNIEIQLLLNSEFIKEKHSTFVSSQVDY
jgi:hypothetical protein